MDPILDYSHKIKKNWKQLGYFLQLYEKIETMNFHKNVKIALPWCGVMLSNELTFCLVSVFKLVH
jgi:hypothetical protein